MKLRDLASLALVATLGCANKDTTNADSDGPGPQPSRDVGPDEITTGAIDDVRDAARDATCPTSAACFEIGCACSQDCECESGICYGGNVCTDFCAGNEGCPARWECKRLDVGEPSTVVRICVPPDSDAAVDFDVRTDDSRDATPHDASRADTGEPDALQVDAARDATLEAALDATREATLDAAPDAVPDAVPDATPDAARDATPDAARDATPDTAVPMPECHAVMGETRIGRRLDSYPRITAVPPAVRPPEVRYVIGHTRNVAPVPGESDPEIFIGQILNRGEWEAPAGVRLNIRGWSAQPVPTGEGTYGLKFLSPGQANDRFATRPGNTLQFALLQDPNYDKGPIHAFPDSVYNQQLSDMVWHDPQGLFAIISGTNGPEALKARFYNELGLIEDECVVRRRDPQEQAIHIAQDAGMAPWSSDIASAGEDGYVFFYNVNLVPENNGRALELNSFTYDPAQPLNNRCQVGDGVRIGEDVRDNSFGAVACDGNQCAIVFRWRDRAEGRLGLSLRRFEVNRGNINLIGNEIPLRPLADAIGEISLAPLGDDRFVAVWDEHGVQLAITEGEQVRLRHQVNDPDLGAFLSTADTDRDTIAVCYLGVRDEEVENSLYCQVLRCTP